MLCSQCRLLRRAGGSVRPTATLRDLYFLFFFDKHPESRQNLAEQCNRISQEIIRASWSLETTLFVLETDEKRSPTKWMIVLACFPVVYSPVHWNGTYTFYSLYADDVFLSFYIRISEQVIRQKRNCITIMWRMPSPFCRWLKCCVCVTHECRGQFPGMPKCQHGRRGAYCSQRASLTVLMVALRASTSPSTHHISHSTVISNRQSVIFQAHNAGSDIKPFRLSNKVKNYILYFRESLL